MNDAQTARKASERFIWLGGWALAAVILVATFGADALRQNFYDPDNAMWLVSVRDMLAGQGLWDNVQHRLNPPDGAPMHWARWINLTIAAPIALLTPMVGSTNAEIVTAFAWPLALLALFMMLVVRVCGELGARDGLRTEAQVAGAIVASLAFPAMAKFSPGSFDHHTIELILAFVAILGLLHLRDSLRWAVVAGIALAVVLATAAEGLPIAAAGVAVAGLLWLFRPQDYGRGLAALGAAFAGSSILLFALVVPPQLWTTPVCDAMSASFLGFALAAGAVAIFLGRGLPAVLGGTLASRLAAAAVLGGLSIAGLWALFPQCAGGGYSAMSAEMKTYWLAQIAETRTLPDLAADDIGLFLGTAGASFAGLIAAAFYLSRRWREAQGWILLGFLLAGWGLLAWQVRGAFFAAAFAIPFGAWATARARQVWKTGTARAGVILFVAAAASSASAAWSAVGEQVWRRITPAELLANYDTTDASSKACLEPEAYSALRSIPRGVMFNNFMLGPGVLQWSSHSAIAAPYHRNADGLMTTIGAMRSDAERARAMVMQTSADYVLICPALPENGFSRRHPADGTSPDRILASLLLAETPPDWLEPLSLTGTPLRLYRVIR